MDGIKFTADPKLLLSRSNSDRPLSTETPFQNHKRTITARFYKSFKFNKFDNFNKAYMAKIILSYQPLDFDPDRPV